MELWPGIEARTVTRETGPAPGHSPLELCRVLVLEEFLSLSISPIAGRGLLKAPSLKAHFDERKSESMVFCFVLFCLETSLSWTNKGEIFTNFQKAKEFLQDRLFHPGALDRGGRHSVPSRPVAFHESS